MPLIDNYWWSLAKMTFIGNMEFIENVLQSFVKSENATTSGIQMTSMTKGSSNKWKTTRTFN